MNAPGLVSRRPRPAARSSLLATSYKPLTPLLAEGLRKAAAHGGVRVSSSTDLGNEVAAMTAHGMTNRDWVKPIPIGRYGPRVYVLTQTGAAAAAELAAETPEAVSS